MRVRELIDVLNRCDPDALVATHANSSEYMSEHEDRRWSEQMRVVEMHACYAGGTAERFVCIGNVSKQNLNGINWHAPKVLDGGPSIDREWSGRGVYGVVRVGTQPVCVACVEDGLPGVW